MGTKPRILIKLLAASLLIACAGCGDDRPSVTSSTTEATVKGTVTVNGKPATKGQVIFDPSNYRRKDAQARTASLNADGSYTITTLIGENVVRVTGPDAEKVSSSYSSISFDVQSGENTYNIKLPPEQ